MDLLGHGYPVPPAQLTIQRGKRRPSRQEASKQALRGDRLDQDFAGDVGQPPAGLLAPRQERSGTHGEEREDDHSGYVRDDDGAMVMTTLPIFCPVSAYR